MCVTSEFHGLYDVEKSLFSTEVRDVLWMTLEIGIRSLSVVRVASDPGVRPVVDVVGGSTGRPFGFSLLTSQGETEFPGQMI